MSFDVWLLKGSVIDKKKLAMGARLFEFTKIVFGRDEEEDEEKIRGYEKES